MSSLARTVSTAFPGHASADLADLKYLRRWWTLAVLSLSLLIIGLDNTILNVAIPTLQAEFSASSSQLQWMVDSYIVVFAGLLLTLGAAGDRFGRARALQAGLFVFGIASVWASQAGSADQLIAARAVMGIGAALIMPATLSILSDVFPREERGKAIAIWSGVAGIGIGLGPLLGGFLLEHFSWGSVFLINAPVVIVALVLGKWLVPDSRDEQAPGLDIPGAILSIAAVSLLVYAIIEAPGHGWLDPITMLTFAGAITLGAAFFWWETRTSEPMLDLTFFRNPRFSVGSSAIGLTFFALFGSVFALTQYLQLVRGYSALEAGARLVPVALGLMIGAGLSSKLVERFGTTRVVAFGMLVVAGSLGSLVMWDVDTPYWMIGSTMLLLAVGMGNVMAPATDAVMGSVPEAKAGVGSAMNDVVREVAGAFGIAILGSILNTTYSGNMDESVTALPPRAAEHAEDSVGGALTVASQLGGQAGDALASAAQLAFVDAMSIATTSAAVIALVGAGLVLRFLPANHLDPEESEMAKEGSMA